MSLSKSLAERLADQAKARERQAERIRDLSLRPVGKKRLAIKSKVEPPPSRAPSASNRPQRLWAQARVGTAPLVYHSRTAVETMSLQPWATDLVNTLLTAADKGGTALCLLWPTKLKGICLLHALANLERVFAKDLRGMRTLFYPGTYAVRAPLDSVLVDRGALSELFRDLWIAEHGSTELKVSTESPAFLAVLKALNHLSQFGADAPIPSLAELIPTFLFDPAKSTWATTASSPLERTLAKVRHRERRRTLRQEVSVEWPLADKAPGALMVMHYSATKKGAWRTALGSPALKGKGRPEVLLLDATEAATRTDYTSVKRIPEFLSYARESDFPDTGAVVVTDDPKTFFILSARLPRAGISQQVYAAESEDALLSSHPRPADWQPALRSLPNFSVSIVDRDASQVALAYQRLTASAGSEDTEAHQALLKACRYVLRLSNMPAGFTDLTALSTESGAPDYSSRQSAWTDVKLALLASISSGAMSQVREALERTITRTEKLIDDWNDATPMAARMLTEVEKHAHKAQKPLCLVLPNSRYEVLAHRYLERKLGADWTQVETHIEWKTLASVDALLKAERKAPHFVFVGLNPDVLRVLMVHPHIPHGTAVLVAYKNAESTLRTLREMKQLEALKPYRGRIGLLTEELERRLEEVPNALDVSKLREMSLTFAFEDTRHGGQNGDPKYFRFELEGGAQAYSSGWVYRYAPEEDPPFRRTPVRDIERGDLIFEMSEELRTKLESSLQLSDAGLSSAVDPVRVLLKLYHDDIQRRCEIHFAATTRSALANEIHAKMVSLDPEAEHCRPARVSYWLDLGNQDDTRPHAARDAKCFLIFCKALGISDESAAQNWAIVRNARRLSQLLGRELLARYAEILFQPESAAIYRKVSPTAIRSLQQEALHCIHRVERVVPPPTYENNDR
jgi:hypothetical protein